MAQSNVVFDIQDVSKVFRSRRKEVQALSHIRLQVKKNEFVALLGTSGCGKSTLLRMLCGLDFPTEGKIFWNGEQITGPGMDRGMVFQGYTLFPWMRVLDNVAYGLRASGMSKQERMDVAKQFCRTLDWRTLHRSIQASSPVECGSVSPLPVPLLPIRNPFCWTSRSAHWMPKPDGTCRS